MVISRVFVRFVANMTDMLPRKTASFIHNQTDKRLGVIFFPTSKYEMTNSRRQ